MASAFIGYSILVTLKNPPSRQLAGVVADVVDQTLILKDVLLLWNRQYLPLYRIDSTAIADLEVVSEQPHLSTTDVYNAPQHVENEPRNHQLAQGSVINDKTRPEPFVDPAILSFAKPQVQTRQVSRDSHASPFPPPDVVSPVMIADSIKHSPISSSQHESQTLPALPIPFSGAASLIAVRSPRTQDRRGSTATATLTEPFDHMALKEEENNLAGAIKAGANKATAKKNRRKVNRKTKEPINANPGGFHIAENVQSGVKKPSIKGKGWRQTPLVEETLPAKSEVKTKRPGHRARNSYYEDTNGWATEDATDIHDLGDFDFEQNLSKFDKRRVFEDISKEDIIPNDERLVSFNRKPRPGTNSGRNLHYTENVLDVPSTHPSTWKSEAGETDDEQRESHYSSGRASRRDGSRRPQPQPSRKEALMGIKSPAAASSATGSTSSSFRTALRMTSTNKPCPCISPLQMLEIEQLCTTELGLTEEILCENAGRGIAESAVTLLPNPPLERPSYLPNILFLVGNHKSGARAIAAARHLRNRNMRTTVVILGGEREDMLLETVKRQADLYRKGSGWIMRWDELQSRLTSSITSPPPSSSSSSNSSMPDLIIDALLGIHLNFPELRTDDQAIAFEMIRWANRSATPPPSSTLTPTSSRPNPNQNSPPIPILSIDVPSGLHASTGEITQIDNTTPLIIHASTIACLAAPKTGVLGALNSEAIADEARSREWKLVVVDVGVSHVAWRKYGSRRRPGVDFGREWVAGLKLVGMGTGTGGGREGE